MQHIADPRHAERSTAVTHTAARTFAIGLGAARAVAGVSQLIATRTFLMAIGAHTPVQAGVILGFRMKGARDLALGVGTLGVARHDRALARTCDAAVIIDGIDGLAVLADRGRTFGPPVSRVGGVGGLMVAAGGAWAGRVLRR